MHKRDMQHGKPSFWQKYIRANPQGNATVYKTNTLADLSQGNATVYKTNTL